jgi:hypothetical protein
MYKNILRFANLELRHDQTLGVTALSEIRMQSLMEVFHDAIGEVNPRCAANLCGVN